MPKMTQSELNAYYARRGGCPGLPKGGVEKESELHDQIFAECRRRGWIALHGAMSERSHRTTGEPDFIVLGRMERTMRTPHGAEYLRDVPFVLFVECKTRTGKLSPEQSAMIYHAKSLGHKIHVVRSFDAFLLALNETGSPVMKEGV